MSKNASATGSTSGDAKVNEDFKWSDVELSDTDVDDKSVDYKVTIAEALDYKLPFGKHKGTPLSKCIRDKNKRSYLRYLAKWDELANPAKANIDKVLEEWSARQNQPPTRTPVMIIRAKKRKKTRWGSPPSN